MLDDLHSRLAGVTIECLPYGDFIRRYDRPETLFYLDPPYWNCENYYGKGLFTRDDFRQLAALLKTLKGWFILSLNDTPEVRKLFSAFTIETIETRYSCGIDAREKVGELLISNYAGTNG